MPFHPDSQKREATIRFGKIPPSLHRLINEHKERHHHDTLWSALLDLAEHGAIVTQYELQVLRILVLNHTQSGTAVVML